MGNYEIPPSEYWQMTPSEVCRIIDVKSPKTVNGIAVDDIDNMLDRREELEAQGIKVL